MFHFFSAGDSEEDRGASKKNFRVNIPSKLLAGDFFTTRLAKDVPDCDEIIFLIFTRKISSLIAKREGSF